MARKVILDVDTGIDDALAILLALRSEELDVLGITCVAGNVGLDQVVRNTLDVLALAHAEVPVYVGARKPLVAPLRTATLFHGTNGVANLTLSPASRAPEGERASEYLCRMAREHRGEVTVIAVGPLTNIALALLHDPDFARNLDTLIVMGGAVHHAGNVNGIAEANFSNDPEAASAVVSGAAGMWLVDLGATSGAMLPLEDFGDPDAPERDEVARFAIRLLRFYGQAYVDVGVPGAILHDPLAVAWAATPELATPISFHLAVETSGTLTRGASIGSFATRVSRVTGRSGHLDAGDWEPQEHNARLARRVESRRFLDLFVHRLGLD